MGRLWLALASLLLAGCNNNALPALSGTQQTAASTTAGTATAAQGPQKYVVPAPSYKTVSREIAIPMDDGIRLGATITFPSKDGKTPAAGRFPVVVSITPYSRNVLGSVPDQAMFASRGIIAVAVDTRGTGGSEGNLNDNYFSPREARDTAAVIEYFGTQVYSTGKVGMAGGSYVGITQLLAAELQPPHLAAIVPQVALSDLYRDGYTHGGIINLFFDLQYLLVQGGPGLAGFNKDPALLAMTLLGKLQQLTGTPIAFDYLAHPNDGPFYRERSPYYHLDRIQVPVLVIDGWRDGFVRGAIENFQGLVGRDTVETRLYIDPCTHKGCGAPLAPLTNPPGQDDLAAMIFEFLSHYLQGAEVPERAPVRVYLQGADHYLEAEQWPPAATQFKTLYLQAAALSAVPPQAGSRESYFTNPLSGLSMSFDMYGTVAASPYLPLDQRLEDGHGLTFRSQVLTAPLTLAGPIGLHLVALSSATDTDWIAKLADVAPDGSETLISNGYLRASHRELDSARSRKAAPYHTHTNPTPIQPGKAYAYDIAIWPTAYQLAAGHRLQLRITSYDVPTHAPVKFRFDVSNPAATQIVPLLPATNTIVEGGTNPSTLMLPVYRPAEGAQA